jgi:FixJ family two-component response regulator
MTKTCSSCGRDEDDPDVVVIGARDPDEDERERCQLCVAEQLKEYTTLSDREAEVIAIDQLAALRRDIVAEELGIAESTVDEYHRRARQKAHLAETTVGELREYV